ncbi:hypothetical protein C0989_010152 [Termitomyces sp. Mn162]|nr:hypothetical protein C0989_010152 [Termitomyces sp. Mn162]
MRCSWLNQVDNDEYFYVKNIARPGETISSYRYERRVGGKGANQAIAIIKAGGTANFYGSVGQDGLWVKDTVGAFGLDPILFPGANCSQLPEETWETSGVAFPECTHVLLQNEIHMECTLYALNNSVNAITVYNPSPMPSSQEINEFPWDKVDWLIVNEGEAEDLYKVLSGHGSSFGEPPSEILLLLSAQPALATTNIICTLGKDGVVAFIPAFHRQKQEYNHNTPNFIRLPAAVLQGTIRDTTGAGDCFTGYFVQGLMEFGPQATPGHGIRESDIVSILMTCVQVSLSKHFSASKSI